ncbi:MAG: hypothetical protein LBP92_14750 [Deltaproteobacteria bacterium]|nr:hypothetical protein [Deltaproteobacteria bacterium]
MRILAQIVAVLLCLAVPGLGLAAPLGPSPCCLDPGEAGARPGADAHGGHRSGDLQAAAHGDLHRTAEPEGTPEGQKSFPFSGTCGLVPCPKLPQASIQSPGLGPLPRTVTAAIFPEGRDLAVQELPRPIFHPPRLPLFS